MEILRKNSLVRAQMTPMTMPAAAYARHHTCQSFPTRCLRRLHALRPPKDPLSHGSSYRCTATTGGTISKAVESLTSTTQATTITATPAPGPVRPEPRSAPTPPPATLNPAPAPARPPRSAFAPPPANSYKLLPPSWEPLIGQSKQFQRLQQAVTKASSDPRRPPLLLVGEVGLHLLELAEYIHAQGLAQQSRHQPLVVVDVATRAGVRKAQELLSGPSPVAAAAGAGCASAGGAVDAVLSGALKGGTLLLNNMHQAPRELLLLAANHLKVSAQSTATGDKTRIICVSQQLLPSLQGVTQIQVPPLRQRPADVGQLAEHYALEAAAVRGYTGVRLTPDALRQLTSYSFPGNEEELHALVFRAVLLHPAFSNPAPTAAGSPPCGCANTTSTLSTSSSDGKAAPYGGGKGDNANAQRCSGAGPHIGTKTTTAASGASTSSCCQDAAAAPSAAAAAAPGAGVLVLGAGDFWAATGDEERGRIDMMSQWPWLRQLLLDNTFWPEGVNAIMKWAFPLVIAMLFLGPQDREHNVALTVFWAGWWPLVLLSFPFIGRAWCAACPFMVYGREAQHVVEPLTTPYDQAATGGARNGARNGAAAGRASSAVMEPTSVGTEKVAGSSMAGSPADLANWWEGAQADWHGLWKLAKWPSEQMSQWGGWFVVVAFAAILAWEEVWDLPNTAALSGWLLLIITGGAVACSVVWERRLWCRYLCPIGGMNGLFAKMSMTEIRSRPQICSATACPRYCHKGANLSVGSHCPLSEQQQALLSVAGCPMNSYPARNQDNHDCIMCGNCLRTCPNGSAQWRLRPPGADLWTNHIPSWSEVNLMFVLLGAVQLGRLPDICSQLGFPADLLDNQIAHVALSSLLLAAPFPIFWLADKVGRAVASKLLHQDRVHNPSTAATPVAAHGGRSGSSSSSSGGSSSSAVAAFDAAADEMPPFLTMAYSFLPLVWAGLLTHYVPLLMTELGQLLPRAALTLRIPEAVALHSQFLPAVGVSSRDVVAAAQGVTLTLGGVLSLVLTGLLAPGVKEVVLLPQRVMVLLLAAQLWNTML